MNGPISKLAHCAIYIHCPPLAFPLASEMDRRPEPRTRSRQTKLRRGSGSPFCLVEQSYSVCGARDERTHAGQQQQLVDQLGHDVLPRNGSGKTTTGSRNFGSATACGPLGFIALMRAASPSCWSPATMPGRNRHAPIGAKRTCREPSERIDLTSLTATGHRPRRRDKNYAVQRPPGALFNPSYAGLSSSSACAGVS
jgi:hypothetical protein